VKYVLYHIGAGEPVALAIQGTETLCGFCVSMFVIFEAYSAVTLIVSVFSYVMAA